MSASPLTVFQQQVLTIITHIPAGKVVTYAEIARAIGRPRAVRAVGNALNKNPNLVSVPCHRVVASTGKLGGYREGEARRRELLRSEGVTILSNDMIQDFSKTIFSLKQYAPSS